jgi:hypothetical protein
MPLAPLNMRQNPVAGTDYSNLPPVQVQVALDGKSDKEQNKNNILRVELPDGSVSINFNAPASSVESDDFNENLALKISGDVLAGLGSELVRLIKQDDESRQEWLQQYVAGLELLGTKIETPRSNASDGSTAVEGQSTVRHPLLIESVVRFQSNARGEMLPATGPVRVRNDGLESLISSVSALALERDFNHYLTVTAPEYYPDTERLFFSLGFGGTAFKKVYYCPLRRRPVSEFVDVKDVIVSNAETNIQSCSRVTHAIHMSASILKRMQLVGIYRDVSLSDMAPTEKNIVDQKIDQLQGITQNANNRTESKDRDIYECYCELDIPGFEHEEDGEPTGLKLPYRVTLDKASEQVLEIRRWWKDGDPSYLRRQVFVEYIFVPGLGFYGLGFLHLLGNTTMALTAALRLCIDNGMFANFPGFLYAKSAGRQLTNEFRVAPGSGVAIDTGGQPIQNMVANLPYRGVDAAFLNLIQMVEQGGQRLGGIADMAVGDANTEAPVGTTIALIEQATKIMSAAHKRMHAAQAREFQLLKELFKECPEAFWENNRFPAGTWTPETLISALDNANLVPVADPNTPSQTARIQKAMAIKQMQTANPGLYDPKTVDMRILTMLGIEDAQSLFAPPSPPPQDPVPMMTAQAKLMDSQSKLAEVKVRALDAAADAQNRAADRESREKIAMYQLAREIAVHPESAKTAESFIQPQTEEIEQESRADGNAQATDLGNLSP